MEFTDALAKFEMEVEDFLSFGKVSTCRDGQHPQARLWHPFLAGILAINVDASVGGDRVPWKWWSGTQKDV